MGISITTANAEFIIRKWKLSEENDNGRIFVQTSNKIIVPTEISRYSARNYNSNFLGTTVVEK